MNPTPNLIKSARLKSGLSRKSAAGIIGYSKRAWKSWELGERKMRQFLFEEFKRLANVDQGEENK